MSGAPAVIVGAGAAGLMAALWAARAGRPVLVLEGSARPGQKILISGGGRCNVLPSRASHADFRTSGSPQLVRKVLAAWPLEEVQRFFERDLGVPLALEEETGKLFPASGRARTVVDALLAAAAQRGVAIRSGARVTALAPGERDWQVTLSSGVRMAARRVILATGGLSVPATGSDGAGLRLATELGHTIATTYPALTPLLAANPEHGALAGLSLPVELAARDPGGRVLVHSRGGFLFTHRGYSGPAVLDISHAVTGAEAAGQPAPGIFVQWTALDAEGWDDRLRAARGPLLAVLRERLPERMARQLLGEAGLAGSDGSQLSRAGRRSLSDLLANYPLPVAGHEGYRMAEVTGGGIPLAEVDPATLESRVAPGLHLCGEMLDSFGSIGGYNFLWAWVTGRTAGEAAA
jgi:hypothetical protein